MSDAPDDEARIDGETRADDEVQDDEVQDDEVQDDEVQDDERADPLVRHRFVVDAEGLDVAGFTEVRGLEVAVDRRTGGNSGDTGGGGWWDWRSHLRRLGFLRKRRDVTTTSPNLELRRGVTDEPVLWKWLQEWTAGDADARNVDVYLLDDDGEPVVGWACSAARPVQWTGPALRADRPDVATETLELTHEGIREADVAGDGKR